MRGGEAVLRAFAQRLAAAPWRAVGWRTEKDVWDLGIRDADAALEALPEALPGTARWLDAGSGNGLNAIPLALRHPGWRGTWVERSGRRAGWLEREARALGLEPEVVARDVSELRNEGRRGYGVVTARALAPPARAAGLLWPFVAPDGLLLLFTGGGEAPAVPGLPPPAISRYSVRDDAPARMAMLWRRPAGPPP